MGAETANKIFRACGTVLFWLLVWQLAAMAVNKPLYIPLPSEVAGTLASTVTTLYFWKTAGASLGRIVLGFLAGTLLGTALALLTHISRLAETVIAPVIKAVRAAPVVSFIILVLVWFSKDRVPVVISALMVLPVIWENVAAAIAATDPQLLEMARIYGFGRMRIVKMIYVPSAMPQFLAACRVGLGLAWKSGITAEVISSPALAIGKQLKNGQLYLETDQVFAWTIVVIILSLLLEKLMVRLLERLGAKYRV